MGSVGLSREELRAGPQSLLSVGTGPWVLALRRVKAASVLCGLKGSVNVQASQPPEIGKLGSQSLRWQLWKCVVQTLPASQKNELGLLLECAALCQDRGL